MDISLIMPVYKAGELIKAAISSFLNQTYKGESELIIIYSPSDDNTLECINSFKSNKIKLIESPVRLGPAEARNLGLEKARGKFIAFFDSDDIIEPSFIEKGLKAFNRENVDIVDIGVYTLKGNKKLFKRVRIPALFSNSSALKALINDISIRGYACGKIYKRFLIDKSKIKIKGLHFFEDFPFNVSLFINARKVRKISSCLYAYRYTPTSITKSKNINRARQHLEMYLLTKEYLKRYGSKKQNKIYKHRYIRNWLSFKGDLYLSKKAGLDQKQIKSLKKDVKLLKKDDITSSSYYEFIKEAITN